MANISSLPQIMVAPNGARRTKKDHPAIPVTIEEIVETAKACKQTGADGLHFHVRDENQKHVLDAGLYKEALHELNQSVPHMVHQITTEAVGHYSPAEQRKLVEEVLPKAVSISIAEMFRDKDEENKIYHFYAWCEEANISVQHILYSQEDLDFFDNFLEKSKLQKSNIQLLFVLGRYNKNLESNKNDLLPYLTWLTQKDFKPDWAVCAFGRNETSCLQEAYKKGGKIRIGFENSLWNQDGSLAKNNQERILNFKKSCL